MKVQVSDKNIHISNSYLITKAHILTILDWIKYDYNQHIIWRERTMKSLEAEWLVHNALYRLHIFRSHTRDVDLNYPCKIEWLYMLLSPIARLIAK